MSEIWIVPDNNKITWEVNKRAWEETILDQTYPATLLRCFEKIAHKIKKDNKKEYNSIIEYMKDIENVNNKLVWDLKDLILNKK